MFKFQVRLMVVVALVMGASVFVLSVTAPAEANNDVQLAVNGQFVTQIFTGTENGCFSPVGQCAVGTFTADLQQVGQVDGTVFVEITTLQPEANTNVTLYTGKITLTSDELGTASGDIINGRIQAGLTLNSRVVLTDGDFGGELVVNGSINPNTFIETDNFSGRFIVDSSIVNN